MSEPATPSRMIGEIWPLILLPAVVLGVGLGWEVRGRLTQQAPAPIERQPGPAAMEAAAPKPAPTAAAPAIPPNQLGSSAPSTVGIGGGTPAPNTTMGMTPAQIIADLVRALEAGEIKGANAVSKRLELLTESGAEGRRAMLDFLKQNADYSVNKDGRLDRMDDSLRGAILKAMWMKRTPESEEAMRYVLDTTPNLEEAMYCLDQLRRWKIDTTPQNMADLRRLAGEQLANLDPDQSLLYFTIQRVGVVARETGDTALQQQVEAEFLARYQGKNLGWGQYAMLFYSYSGEWQEDTLRRLGAESPHIQSLKADPRKLTLLDFTRPSLRELATTLLFDGDVSTENIVKFLGEDDLLKIPGVSVDGYGTGGGWSGYSKHYKTETQRLKHLQRLDALDGYLTEIQRRPGLDPAIAAAAEAARLEIPRYRDEAENGKVSK